MPSLAQHLALSTNFIVKQTKLHPKAALILGSGLGGLADQLDDATAIPYRDVPSFPATSVPGHRGRLLVGRMHGVSVVVFDGRLHLYEGLPMSQVSYPVYVARQLGVSTLVVTNAAGGINAKFVPGTIMLIRDHINMTGASPLTGQNDPDLGERFPSMRGAYDAGLRDVARRTAARDGIELAEGVYVAMLGPNYETGAELRMLRSIGADAVGMSTVPEVIAARHAGIRVAGLSVISNYADPDRDDTPEITHEEVQAVVAAAAPRVRAIVEGIVEHAGG